MTEKSPRTVFEYLRGLDPERRAMLSAVRKVVNDNLPEGYAEGVTYGMIAWYIPLAAFPNTYNGQPLCIAALTAGKHRCSLHLMAAYGDPGTREWLVDQFRKSGKKLDMGKACIHFKAPDDLPLDAIAKVIAKVTPQKYIERYEASRGIR